jgi:hypothetical protein
VRGVGALEILRERARDFLYGKMKIMKNMKKPGPPPKQNHLFPKGL